MRERGMRFLKLNKDSKLWEIASQKLCREKVGHALRDTRDGKNKNIAQQVPSLPSSQQQEDEDSQETMDGTDSVISRSRKCQSLPTLPDSSDSYSERAGTMRVREQDGNEEEKIQRQRSNKKKPVKKRKMRPNPPRSEQQEESLDRKMPALSAAVEGRRKYHGHKKRRTSSISSVCSSSSSSEAESFPEAPPIAISGRRQNQEEQKADLGNLQFLVRKLKDAQRVDRGADSITASAPESSDASISNEHHPSWKWTNASQIQQLASPVRSEDESSFGSACLDDLNELSLKELADFLLECPFIGKYEGDY